MNYKASKKYNNFVVSAEILHGKGMIVRRKKFKNDERMLNFILEIKASNDYKISLIFARLHTNEGNVLIKRPKLGLNDMTIPLNILSKPMITLDISIVIKIGFFKKIVFDLTVSRDYN